MVKKGNRSVIRPCSSLPLLTVGHNVLRQFIRFLTKNLKYSDSNFLPPAITPDELSHHLATEDGR